jgi:hypothetical protein
MEPDTALHPIDSKPGELKSSVDRRPIRNCMHGTGMLLLWMSQSIEISSLKIMTRIVLSWEMQTSQARKRRNLSANVTVMPRNANAVSKTRTMTTSPKRHAIVASLMPDFTTI